MENSFGWFLKQKRQEKNLTQKQLAKILFVTESAVSKWEKDVAHPDITLLPKLSEILGVSEHELITASVDESARKEKAQAKKWRTLSFSWSLFFYVAYALALTPCFICNLAINKTLSWFWIVFFALVLAFSFTNLPKLIKKHKLVLIPLSMFLSLCALLGVCAIYTKGDWFLIAVFSVLLAMVMVFVPIYISKLKIFEKIKKYNDFVSVAVSFVFLNILLIVIDCYAVANGYALNHWYFKLALPIVTGVYLVLNLFMSVRFLKLNKLLKSSIILFGVNLIYCLAPLFKSSKPEVQKELEKLNFFKANFADWRLEISLQRNIHAIIFLTVFVTGLFLFVFGLIRYLKKRKQNKI